MNLNDGVIRGGAIESLGARIALPRDMRREPAEGTGVRWGVRPEYVRWSDDGADDGPGAVSGRVHTVENLGAQNLLTMRCEGEHLQAASPGASVMYCEI